MNDVRISSCSDLELDVLDPQTSELRLGYLGILRVKLQAGHCAVWTNGVRPDRSGEAEVAADLENLGKLSVTVDGHG